MLRLEAVSSGYGRHAVINGVSEVINGHEITAIVGPNGHGKSTLMATMSGLLPVMSGRIFLADADVTRASPQERLRRGVVHVPQGDRLFPDMSVEENLLVGATVLGSGPKVRETLEWTLDLMPAVRERLGRTASALSGGERRLVGIARSLMTGRKFIMLDEPSLGLSPVAVDSVYAIIERLSGEGYGFVIIEENLDRVAAIANRIVFVLNGRIEWSGSSAQLRDGGKVLKRYLGS